MDKDLTRFLQAQDTAYEAALSEVRSGRKRSHWMWYIFPQLEGLGFSETSRYFAIKDIDEARQYLLHPVLGSRLREITEALLTSDAIDAYEIFGSPDNLKLKSSMTLFTIADGSLDSIFRKVIERFFEGKMDEKTLALMDMDET